jgi:hypothetical protein
MRPNRQNFNGVSAVIVAAALITAIRRRAAKAVL